MATIRDVARESGVSVATVSYVLNDGPRPVSPHTRERVLAVMKSLDYHPNAIARSLVRRRTQTLGVLLGPVQPEVVTNNYYAGILSGVFAGATHRGYNILFFTAGTDETQIRAQKPDGVLMISPSLGEELPHRLARARVPLAVIGSGDAYKGEGVLCLDVDHAAGIQQALCHLRERGYARIVHLMGSDNIESMRARRACYEKQMAQWGLPVELFGGSFEQDEMRQEIAAWLRAQSAPVALIAGNDDLALWTLQVAQELGKRIPKDLAVVGFDDCPLAPYTQPALTTVRQPMRRIGERAVEVLVDKIEASAATTTATEPLQGTYFKPTLVIRESA